MDSFAPDDSIAAADRMVGRWECYEGDGIHGWDNRVISIARVGDRLTVDEIIPPWPGTSAGARRFGPYTATCSQGEYGLQLLIDDGDQSLWHIRPSIDTFVLWQTQVGTITFPRFNGFRRIGVWASRADAIQE